MASQPRPTQKAGLDPPLLSAPVPDPLIPKLALFEDLLFLGTVPAPPGSLTKEEPVSLDQLRKFAQGGYLFALMDSADQILVPHKAKQLGPATAISLFSGTAKEEHWAVAPYLFHVTPDLLDWMVAKLWKEPWGIFAIAKATFEELRIHFKKFLLVQLPDGKVWFFRYYDPRILRAYLPVCEAWELHKFFGPIRAFATGGGEQEEPSIVHGLKDVPVSQAADVGTTFWWKIRPEHRAEFRRVVEKGFLDRCLEFLTVKLPSKVESLPPTLLRARVEAGIMLARSYGVTWQSSLLMFVTLMFEAGPSFHRDPIVQRLLRDNRTDPNSRVKQIVKFVSSGELKRMELQADPNAWDMLVRSAARVR